MDYFEHRSPCDPSLIGKFRKLIGEEEVEELLAKTITVAVNQKLISKKAFRFRDGGGGHYGATRGRGLSHQQSLA